MTTAASPGQITGSTDTTSNGGFFGDSTVNGISNLIADDVVAAQTAATNAAASATSAATSYDNFDDRYLGQKSTDPTVDNDGDALLTGALYFNTTNNVMKVYNGSAWQRTTPTSSDQTNINALSQSAVITDMALLANADVITDMSILGTADVVADLNTLGTADVVNDMNVLGTASNVTNMDTLAGISGDITTVAGINSNVTTVAGISSNVTTVANDSTDVTTVATNISNVNTVAGIDSNVTTVAGIASDVTAVANDATDIGIVSTNISSVNTVATNIADVITVAGDLTEAISEIETAANDLNEATSEIDTVANSIANVDTVGTNISNVNTVAGISGNVTTVAGVTSDVTTVAGISGDVSTVAGISSNVTTVSGISSNVTSVAGVASDVSTVAPIVANVTTVAGISPNVTTVAGISSDVTTVSSNTANITTVAGIDSDVTTVAGISSNVTSVANNESNINSAVSNASNINTVSGSISNVNTVATNISSVNNFSEVYRISSTAPTTSLNIGDLYFNTTSNSMQVYGASGWQNAGSSVNGTSERFHYDITSTVGSVSGADANGNTLAYDSGYVDVYVNGVRMSTADITITSGDTVTFAEDLVNGDEVDIVAYGTFSITNLDASNLDSGTVPSARITGAYTGITTAGQLTFADNERAIFGGGSDLQIYHDTSANHSYISESGSGDLIIEGGNIRLENGSSQYYIRTYNNAQVELYYANAEKLATTNTGIDVTGNITVSGTVDGRDVASDGSKLDGIESGATADQSASEILTLIKTVDGSGSGLDADTLDSLQSSQFLRSDAIDTKTSGNLNFANGIELSFGTGDALRLVHDGANSIIRDQGTGSLFIDGSSTINFRSGDGGEYYAIFNDDGAVTLRHDNSQKFSTTATGIDVTGTVEFGDGHTIGNDPYDNLALYPSTNEGIALKSRTYIDFREGDSALGTADGARRMLINEGGDISFYEDTGTTAKMVWKASDERLGIGTSSPAAPLDVAYADNANIFRASYASSEDNFFLELDSDILSAGVIGYQFHLNNNGTLYNNILTFDRGNVGIGTDSPRGKLDITNSDSANGTKIISEVTSSDVSANNNASFSLYEIGTEYGRLQRARDGSGTIKLTALGTQHLSLETLGAGNMYFKTNDTRRMQIESNGNIYLGYEDTGSTPKLFWDASAERLGIGLANPTSELTVGGNASTTYTPTVAITDTTSGATMAMRGQSPKIAFDVTSSGVPKILMDNAGLEFKTGTLDAEGDVDVKIDSSGNLLVGMTSPSNLTTGFSARANSLSSFCRDTATADAAVLALNKKTGDGDILIIQKDGSTVGSIGAYSSRMYIGTGDVGLQFLDTADNIIPINTSTLANRDGAIDLGASSVRFKDLYLSGGVYLGGTGSANFLDDYEEGTFTVTLRGGTTTGAFNYSDRVAHYIKIGDLVTVSVEIAATTSSPAPVGQLEVAGLPFTCDRVATGTFQCNDMGSNYDTNVAQYTAIIQSGNAHIHYRGTKDNNTAYSALQAQSMSFLRTTITYKAQ